MAGLTVSQLRAEAREKYKRGSGQMNLKGYARMSRAELMARLGKSTQEKRDNRAVASTKTADAIASKLVSGADDKAVARVQAKARLLRRVKRDLDAARKTNPDISQDELRKVAGKAFLAEAKAIKDGKPENKGKSESKPAVSRRVDPVVSTRAKELDETRQQMIGHVGKATVERVEKHFQQLIDKSDPFVVVPSSVVDKIISQGRFKSSFETRSKSDTYGIARTHFESEQMGIDVLTKPQNRPIYGYLGGKDYDPAKLEHKGATFYGDVAIRLKPQVKERASITDYDSFKASMPSPAHKFNAASLLETTYDPKKPDAMKGKLESLTKEKDISGVLNNLRSPYLEMQFHGGLKSADIGELIYTKGKPSKKVLAWAQKNGVKVTVK